ncbi:response regulator [Nocardia sp. NBC_00565]|uniref:response regulator n=1 Tax=Nocardia sp. NBC_00565 TaxID=2975993 RepID=UPI002E80F41A|nr:response regulator [Nocardia sp. NBC_00565]WUC02277.1 response regulator [Nocardia sp. NBC_00565]
MKTGMRILVASPLGKVIAPTLIRELSDPVVTVAVDRREVQNAITATYRFDVVIADLVWNNPALEFSFDGLDVVNMLAAADRLAPILIATQGHSMEQDLLDEARLRPEVAGVYAKSSGVATLLTAIHDAAIGQRSIADAAQNTVAPLYALFDGQRGSTSGRLAGAIAAGRASDAPTLARAAQVGINTANKVTSTYLGPIIQQRGEHDPEIPMTLGAVYRWCGLHARYLTSWCRRNGHDDVLLPKYRADTG